MANLLQWRSGSDATSEDVVCKIVRCCPIPTVIIDRDELTILELNDSASSLYGYSRAELVGEQISKLRYVGDDILGVNRMLERLCAQEKRKIWAHQTSAGSLLLVKLTGVSVGDVATGSQVVFVEPILPSEHIDSGAVRNLHDGEKEENGLLDEYVILKNSVEYYASQVRVIRNVIHETQPETGFDREARRQSIKALLKRLFPESDIEFFRCEGETVELLDSGESSDLDIGEHQFEIRRTQVVAKSLWRQFLLEHSRSAWVKSLDNNRCMCGVVHFRRPTGWIAVLRSQEGREFSRVDVAAFEIVCLILLLNSKLANAEQRITQFSRFETMGEIVGTIAHDFNNLLQIITGNAEVFERSLRKNEKLGPLSKMNLRAVQSATKLTARLLSFSSLRNTNLERICILRMLGDLDHLLRRSIPENISIKIELVQANWEFLADAVQFENAILNLCLNARDALPNGGNIKFCVDQITSTEEVSLVNNVILPPGDYLKITVEDNGHGIDEKDFKNVFEPFFSNRDVKVGRGLGLSSVKRFVEELSGGIDLKSSIGQGTKVTLYLSRFVEVQSSDTFFPDDAVGQGQSCGKILYVEDDDRVRGYVISQLSAANIGVLEARSGADALRLVQSIERLDVLVTDVIMPGFGGDKLALLVRKRFPGIKVVFTSGYGSDKFTDRESLESIGKFLRKPFRIADLILEIQNG